jgi:hypothetical protein
LINPTARFYCLKYAGKVVSFCRFEKRGPAQKKFASFNTDQAFRGGALGEAMMERAVADEGHDSDIFAECIPTLGISAKYIALGFLGTELTEFKHAPIMRIERPAGEARARGTAEEIIADYERFGGRAQKDGTIIKKARFGDIEPFRQIGRGYSLTKYFIKDGIAYLAFEKIKV